MNEKLKPLDALQKIDLSILDLTRSGESYPKRLDQLESELTSARSQWDAEEARLAENDRQRREMEERLEEEREKVKKWEARLTEQRTTREYSALAREIDIAKKANITLHEELQALSKLRDEIEVAAIEKKEALDARQQTVGVEAEDLKRKIGELQGRIDELSGKRADAAKLVDTALLPRYESIRKRRGVSLVPVRDGGTCSGCQMRIPPQQYNQLRSGVPFDNCRSCGRIIYVEEAPRS